MFQDVRKGERGLLDRLAESKTDKKNALEMNKRKRSFLSLSLSLQAFSYLCQQKQKQTNSLTSSRSRQIKRPVTSSLFFILLYGEGPHQQRPGSRVLILVGVESRYAKKNSTARNSPPLSLTRPQSPSVPSIIHTRDMEEHAGARGNILIPLGISQAFSKRFPSVFSHNAKPRRTRKNQALRGCVPYFPANMGASL